MQAHVFISGIVQGVGYRYFIKSNAQKLGITGWVKNTNNGKVEAVFQGEQEKLQQMIALSHQGPVFSEVNDIQLEWEEEKKNSSEFKILK